MFGGKLKQNGIESGKNQFDISFQEIVFTDKKSGEKHIADICLSNDLVIEFQHSPILPEEQLARETFYKNMIWVVDGTRLKNDFKRFIKGRTNTFEYTLFYETEKPKIFKVQFIDWCLPNNWLKSSVPVLFDFYGDGTFSDFTEFRKPLYCVFPFQNEYAVVAEISRETFVNTTKNGEWSDRVHHFMKSSFYNEIVSNKNIAFKKQQRTVYTINGIPLLGGKRTFMRRFKKK